MYIKWNDTPSVHLYNNLTKNTLITEFGRKVDEYKAFLAILMTYYTNKY